MKTKHLLLGSFFILLTLALVSCAPVGMSEKQYGLLYGIIHGLLFYAAVISKLFGMEFDLYAHHNTGFWYWAGYAFGVFGFGGGIFGSSRRRRA